MIAGVTKPEQVASNVEAASWQPSEEARKDLEDLGTPEQSYTTYAD